MARSLPLTSLASEGARPVPDQRGTGCAQEAAQGEKFAGTRKLRRMRRRTFERS